MAQLKCLVIDDEPLAQDLIENYLKNFSFIKLIAKCDNALIALEWIRKQKIDLIFLDVSMPFISGIDFIRTLQNPPAIILTTAHKEFAVESYELNVLDYLLKPISFERFSKAVNKLLDGRLYTPAGRGITGPSGSPLSGGEGSAGIASLPQGDHIFVKSNSKFFRVNFSEITYVEGMKDYLKIHTPDYTLVTHQTMNELEKLLPARLFIRVHRSYLVAIAQIRAIYGNSIELGKVTIPIGVNYKEAVMGLIGRK